MSSAGNWNSLYRNISVKSRDTHPIKFGDGITYRIAAAFLCDVAQVEDWGCGTGAFKEYCLVGYVGIDGSKSPYADRIADLSTYRSKTPAIHIRHVLEHNHDWEAILANAVASAEQKLCLCLFTPFATSTVEIATNTDITFRYYHCRARRLSGISKACRGVFWRTYQPTPSIGRSTSTWCGSTRMRFVIRWRSSFGRPDWRCSRWRAKETSGRLRRRCGA